MKNNDQSQLTQLLANEQTFLAWLRTGIEVMAFGFVAIKFSLFSSQVMGIVLVGVGCLMIVFSYFRHRTTLVQLRKGNFKYDTNLLTAITIMVFAISIILMIFLISVYLDPAKDPEKIEKT